MSICKKQKTICGLIVAIGLVASTTASARHGHGHHHHHWYDGPRVYHNYNYNDWSYDRGDYYGGHWSGPNVIINVPSPNYYVPECHNIEVCTPYGKCWIESRCD